MHRINIMAVTGEIDEHHFKVLFHLKETNLQERNFFQVNID